MKEQQANANTTKTKKPRTCNCDKKKQQANKTSKQTNLENVIGKQRVKSACLLTSFLFLVKKNNLLFKKAKVLKFRSVLVHDYSMPAGRQTIVYI